MDAGKTGELIAQRRKELELSQEELARRIHVTDKAVSKWETGRGMPGIQSLEPLAEVLELSVSELLSGQRLTAEELPQAAGGQIVESMKKARARIFQGALAALLLSALAVGAYVGYHYLTSAAETDLAALEKKAAEYLGQPSEIIQSEFGYEELSIVETERRGDYLGGAVHRWAGPLGHVRLRPGPGVSRPLAGRRREAHSGGGDSGQLEFRQFPGGGHHLLRRGPARGCGLLYLPEQRHHLHLSH